MPKEESLQVKVVLKGHMIKKFKQIKQELGVEADAEAVRALIARWYNEKIAPKHE